MYPILRIAADQIRKLTWTQQISWAINPRRKNWWSYQCNLRVFFFLHPLSWIPTSRRALIYRRSESINCVTSSAWRKQTGYLPQIQGQVQGGWIAWLVTGAHVAGKHEEMARELHEDFIRLESSALGTNAWRLGIGLRNSMLELVINTVRATAHD